MSKKEATTSGTVVSGTPFSNLKPFYVLFEPSVTHSFISTQFVLQILDNAKIETNYTINLPNDFIAYCPIFDKYVLISISGTICLGDLIQFDLLDFDIILGMH